VPGAYFVNCPLTVFGSAVCAKAKPGANISPASAKIMNFIGILSKYLLLATGY
jgi:hypothetical protein